MKALLKIFPARASPHQHAVRAGRAGTAVLFRLRALEGRRARRGVDVNDRLGHVLDAIALLTIAVASLELAQTIVEEEVQREAHMSAPTRVREQEEQADLLLDGARNQAELYGVRIVERLVRARSAGRAIVEEAERRQSEIVVLGAPRAPRRQIFGPTADYVLRHAPCRVMVAAGTKAA